MSHKNDKATVCQLPSWTQIVMCIVAFLAFIPLSRNLTLLGAFAAITIGLAARTGMSRNLNPVFWIIVSCWFATLFIPLEIIIHRGSTRGVFLVRVFHSHGVGSNRQAKLEKEGLTQFRDFVICRSARDGLIKTRYAVLFEI